MVLLFKRPILRQLELANELVFENVSTIEFRQKTHGKAIQS